MSLPSMNFLHLTVSEIQPGQTFSPHAAAHPPMGENNNPTALKGCGVKTIKQVKTDAGMTLSDQKLILLEVESFYRKL